MASGLTAKVRLVRCPKCRLLLLELPELDVYECGGCHTTLQAKKRVNGAKSTASSSHDTEAVQTNRPDHVSECKDPSSSSSKEILPYSGEVSSAQNNGQDQNGSSGGSDGEHLGGIDLSKENQNKGSDHNDCLDCGIEQSEVSNKVRSSLQVSGHENSEVEDNKNKNLSDNGIENMADNKNEDLAGNEIEDLAGNEIESLADNRIGDLADNGHEECLDDNKEFPHDEDEEISYEENGEFAHKNGHSADNENESSEDTENGECAHNNCNDSADNEKEFEVYEDGECAYNEPVFSHKKNEDFSHKKNEESLPLPEADLTVAKNDESSPVTEADMVYINRDCDSYLKSSSMANLEATMGNGSTVSADIPVEPRISSDTYVSSPDGQLHQPLGTVILETMVRNGSIVSAGKPKDHHISSDTCTSSPSEQLDQPLGTVTLETMVGNGSIVSADKPDDHHISSDTCTSSPSEQLEQPLGTVNLETRLGNGSIVSADKPEDHRISSDTCTSSPSEQREQPLGTVDLETTMGNGSIVSTDKPEDHRISLDTCMSSPDEQLEQPQGSVHLGFGQLRSVETSENMEFSHSSELSGTLRDRSKSSTVRSAHGYDGSISSYDGIDDQIPNPHLQSVQDTYKSSYFVHSEERYRRDKSLMKSTVNKNSQMPYEDRNSWSDKKKHVLKNDKWNQDEFLEPSRRGNTVRNWTRSERDEYQPRLGFHRNGIQPGYGNGSLSSQLHDDFLRNSGFQPSDLSENLEQDKMKLMRMIFELQDQLNKTLSLHEMGSDGISVASRKSRYIPKYHNYDASEDEQFHHLNYPRYGGYGARSSCSQQQHRPPPIPFSGETTSSGHQVDPSCLHCRAQGWHHLAQFHPPLPYSNNKRYRTLPGHICTTSYNSCPSSPQRFLDSEYPVRGCEAMSDDQRQKSHEVKSYLREKPHLVKRHLRPVAGGAPFITCYRCYKLLQLPADFLLFKRRSHRLRCGACSRLLKFSLCDHSRVVPYTMNAMDPPPSEVEDYSGAVDVRNLPSTSQANEFLSADPVSCSDDYGLSHCQSCSTEGDLVSTTFHTHQGSMDGKKMSNGSYDPIRGKRDMVSRQSQNKYKNSLLRYEYAGPSSSTSKGEKSSSKIERLPPSSGSPLHRLMGYSSPSQVIRGSERSRRRTNPYSMQKETETGS